MLPEDKEEPRSCYSPDFRETLRGLEVRARGAARWGRGFLLLSLILVLLAGALLANSALASEEKGEGQKSLIASLRGSATSIAWLSLIVAFMRIAFWLIQRSWELENQLLRLRVCADYSNDPHLASEMIKILDKESERAGRNRSGKMPFVVRRRRGKKPESPSD